MLDRAPLRRARQRRYRQRQRTGRIVVTVEITPEETARLCRLRYLDETHLEDRERIAAAIHALLGGIILDR